MPASVRGVVLTLDHGRRLAIERVWEDERAGGGRSRSPGPVRTMLRKRYRGSVVIAADSSLAYTTVVPISLKRDSAQAPLVPIELENLLSQAVGKIYNQCREAASRELGVNDLDTVLAHSKIVNFKVDGHRVMNPVGFRARTVEAVFDLTLTSRDVLRDVQALLASRDNFFFTEISRAELMSLRTVFEPPLNVLTLGVPRSLLSTMRSAAVGFNIHRTVIKWRPDACVNALVDEWNVPSKAARDLYGLYLSHALSANLERALSRLFAPSLKRLFDGVRALKLRGAVYTTSESPLPFGMPCAKGRTVLEDPPLLKILDHFGFHMDFDDAPIGREHLFRRLAPFIEFYYDKSESPINRWLRRHLHWLGSSM